MDVCTGLACGAARIGHNGLLELKISIVYTKYIHRARQFIHQIGMAALFVEGHVPRTVTGFDNNVLWRLFDQTIGEDPMAMDPISSQVVHIEIQLIGRDHHLVCMGSLLSFLVDARSPVDDMLCNGKQFAFFGFEHTQGSTAIVGGIDRLRGFTIGNMTGSFSHHQGSI